MPKHAIKMEAQGDRCLSKDTASYARFIEAQSLLRYIQTTIFFLSPISSFFLFFLLFRVPPIYALSIEALLQLSRSLSERCVHAYEACTPPKKVYLLNDVGNITRAVCREYFSQFSGTYIGNML